MRLGRASVSLFATVGVLSTMAITLYVTVAVLERLIIRWRRNIQ